MDAGADHSSASDEGRRHEEDEDDKDDTAGFEETRRETGLAAEFLNLACGRLPVGTSVEDFRSPPAKTDGHNAEARYWRNFVYLL